MSDKEKEEKPEESQKPESVIFTMNFPQGHGLEQDAAGLDAMVRLYIEKGFFGLNIDSTSVVLVVDPSHMIDPDPQWKTGQPSDQVLAAQEVIYQFYQNSKLHNVL